MLASVTLLVLALAFVAQAVVVRRLQIQLNALRTFTEGAISIITSPDRATMERRREDVIRELGRGS